MALVDPSVSSYMPRYPSWVSGHKTVHFTSAASLDEAVASLARTGVVKGYALVQAAGLMRGGPAVELTESGWDEMLDINARGLFFMMQQVVLQSMSKCGGSIVNFSSMAGIRGMNIPMCSAQYSASKGAVVALTMQGAVEWASNDIRVNAVAPGGVLTPAMQKLGFPPEAVEPIPLKRLSAPQDVANAVTFLASDAAAMITGQVLVVDGGSSVVGY